MCVLCVCVCVFVCVCVCVCVHRYYNIYGVCMYKICVHVRRVRIYLQDFILQSFFFFFLQINFCIFVFFVVFFCSCKS